MIQLFHNLAAPILYQSIVAPDLVPECECCGWSLEEHRAQVLYSSKAHTKEFADLAYGAPKTRYSMTGSQNCTGEWPTIDLESRSTLQTAHIPMRSHTRKVDPQQHLFDAIWNPVHAMHTCQLSILQR